LVDKSSDSSRKVGIKEIVIKNNNKSISLKNFLTLGFGEQTAKLSPDLSFGENKGYYIEVTYGDPKGSDETTTISKLIDITIAKTKTPKITIKENPTQYAYNKEHMVVMINDSKIKYHTNDIKINKVTVQSKDGKDIL